MVAIALLSLGLPGRGQDTHQLPKPSAEPDLPQDEGPSVVAGHRFCLALRAKHPTTLAGRRFCLGLGVHRERPYKPRRPRRQW
jgi:hypothetical protein